MEEKKKKETCRCASEMLSDDMLLIGTREGLVVGCFFFAYGFMQTERKLEVSGTKGETLAAGRSC